MQLIDVISFVGDDTCYRQTPEMLFQEMQKQHEELTLHAVSLWTVSSKHLPLYNSDFCTCLSEFFNGFL